VSSNSEVISTINVRYKFLDGYHVFTSRDVRGLYVASRDPEKAFNSVGPILSELLQYRMSAPVVVEPAVDLEEFYAGNMSKVEAAPAGRRPKGVRGGSYVIRRRAA
jgi:hypothetical protein